MSSRASRLLRLGLTTAVLVLLVVFAIRLDWGRIWLAARGASPALLVLAAALNLGSLALKGVRWWVFLRPVGARSLPLALRATAAGAGLNNVLIANGGDAARVLFVARSTGVPTTRILATLALERLFELAGYALLLALAAIFLDLPPMLAGARPWALAAMLALGALLVYLVRHPGALPQSVGVERGRLRRIRAAIARVGGTMAHLSTGARTASALALTAGAWLLQVATYHVTARAAHLDMPLVGTVAALLVVNLGFAIRATPGGVGIFQVLYAAAATAFGLEQEQAIAVALLIQAQQVVPVTALGGLLAPEFLLRRRRAVASTQEPAAA
ncbi:MAG TPA: lysylphosphatidylglycerol synthase transmembrane domain-containing protein [Gemmatimonadaceae bacterium]|nr:lysylphosphatidylglycerol synthase transmembrane domain-containing protein [Gemmatimonadaceae bacterium]